jgi:hypothetical protein
VRDSASHAAMARLAASRGSDRNLAPCLFVRADTAERWLSEDYSARRLATHGAQEGAKYENRPERCPPDSTLLTQN